MAVIQELSPHMADLIAAGEVVERPASVAKELIENAIDAGAAQIMTEIEHGGISYLRIADNGGGMSAEDAPIAFLRHATSKVRTEADLTAIGTLGFRGEALAAISAVSRIDLFTRQPEAIAGIHLHLEAGRITVKEEAGCPEGTTMIVRDLFYNTPARMKFLKKDFTEAGYILSVVQHAALSHPEIAFTLIRDGKQVFSTDGKGKLLMPVFAVFGKEMTADMIEIPPVEQNHMTVSGYIVKPYAGRANRSMQHFFVNGRYIKSRLMQAALEEAYRNAMITGKYPSGAVFLTLPPQAVDVNVHPAKTEVKFAQERPVFETVYFACKNALMADDNIPTLKQRPETPEEPEQPNQSAQSTQVTQCIPAAPPVTERQEDEEEEFEVLVPPRAKLSGKRNPLPSFPTAPPDIQSNILSSIQPEPQPESEIPATQQATAPADPQLHLDGVSDPSARVIGECFQTYLVAEDSNGLLLIDKHAAHERILFNKLRAGTEIPQQELLTPVIVELTGEEAAAIREHLSEIRQAGFTIDTFGENSFAVRSAPAYLDAGDVTDVICELAEKAMNSRVTIPDGLDELLHLVACKAAIKAGHPTSREEMQDLCDRVLQDQSLRSCPHGRPTTVRLTRYELDKMFKRVNP